MTCYGNGPHSPFKFHGHLTSVHPHHLYRPIREHQTHLIRRECEGRRSGRVGGWECEGGLIKWVKSGLKGGLIACINCMY